MEDCSEPVCEAPAELVSAGAWRTGTTDAHDRSAQLSKEGQAATMRLNLILAIVVCSSLCQSSGERKTLFTDGFERTDETGTLPLGWTHFSRLRTASLSTKHVFEGKYSLCIVDESPKDAVGLRSPHIKTAPGQSVWVSWSVVETVHVIWRWHCVPR